jgi:Flp pilus assembly protein TadG
MKRNAFFRLYRDERGVTAVLVAILLLALIAIMSLAVDVGYLMAARNQLQNVADSAALAAARQLGAIYEPMTYAEQQAYTCDPGSIVPVAQDAGLKNEAAGKSIAIDGGDVSIGRWDSAARTFTATLASPNAVRVTARRDGTVNGPVSTFFARIFPVDTVPVSAVATAALTGQSTAGPADLEIPVGISDHWFSRPDFCDQPIKFYPTGTLDGCAGWHTYESWPSNAAKLSRALNDLEAGVTPEGVPDLTVAGDTEFVFTGGTVASAFEDMKSLFEEKRTWNPETGREEWETVVVVYDSSSLSDPCGNPANNLLIVGFATAIVTDVLESPDKTIIADVKCDSVNYGRGSGGNFGTLGSIPALVE